MEIITSKNILHAASIPIKQSTNLRDKWYRHLAEFLYSLLNDKQVSFLSYYPPDKSIGAVFCKDSQKINNYDSTQYYYSSSNLSKLYVEQLVSDEEFYLGNIIMIQGILNSDEISMISIYRDSELILSNQQMFKMGDDGNSLFCYNMKDENFDAEFSNFLENIRLL
jgi:hypothetical protein